MLAVVTRPLYALYASSAFYNYVYMEAWQPLVISIWPLKKPCPIMAYRPGNMKLGNGASMYR